MVFPVGSVVMNLNTVALVVGVWNPPEGITEGWNSPILRELGRNGKPRGGKWVASPDKVTLIAATPKELVSCLYGPKPTPAAPCACTTLGHPCPRHRGVPDLS